MDMEIRALGADDEKEIRETSEIYVECYHHDYGSFLPQGVLDRLNVDDEARGCKQWLQQDANHLLYAGFVDHRMVGYISVSPYRDLPLPYEMEISGFFVGKNHRNKGYGLRLLHHAVHELVSRGTPSIIVYCYEDGDSLGFYRSLAGEEVRRETQHAGGKPLEVVCFGWDTKELLATLDRKLRKH